MDLYFARHDNQAVTIDDFVAAMADASGIDLGRFQAWYHQAGTPELAVVDAYDAGDRRYTLTVTPAHAADARASRQAAAGHSAGDGPARRRRRARCRPAWTERGRAARRHPRAAGHRAPSSASCFEDVATAAGALVAARLLGPGPAVRSVAGSAALPRRARHRSVRALGLRPAIRDRAAARSASPAVRRGETPPVDAGADRGDGGDAGGGRGRPRLRRRGAQPAERDLPGRPDGRGRHRRDPRRARARARNDRQRTARCAARQLRTADRPRPLSDRWRLDRPARAAQYLPVLSARSRSPGWSWPRRSSTPDKT